MWASVVLAAARLSNVERFLSFVDPDELQYGTLYSRGRNDVGGVTSLLERLSAATLCSGFRQLTPAALTSECGNCG